MSLFGRGSKKTPAPTLTDGRSGNTEDTASMREFVYLDEVSVYSLTSSPDSPPPISIAETTDSSFGGSVGTHLEVSAPAIAKSSIDSELTSSRSNGLEIQRHFNIQSQFARLHRSHSGSFALTAGVDGEKRRSIDDLDKALSMLEESRRAVRAADLTRGTLAELRMTLRAHSMFDVASFIRTAGGLIDRHPELLQIADAGGMKQAMELGEFLNELMGDLIPIEGRSTRYECVIDSSGEQWIADIPALNGFFEGIPTTSPLRVVGVAERESFWKDTRRVLHADAEFDVLGRVSRPGLQVDWSPVKLADTFERVVPGAAAGLNEALNSLRNLAVSPQPTVAASSLLAMAAAQLRDDLAAHHGVSAQNPADHTLGTLSPQDGGIESELVALGRVADDFYAHFVDLERDQELVGQLRERAWRAAHAVDSQEQGPNLSSAAEPLGLELEFIAIYW